MVSSSASRRLLVGAASVALSVPSTALRSPAAAAAASAFVAGSRGRPSPQLRNASARRHSRACAFNNSARKRNVGPALTNGAARTRTSTTTELAAASAVVSAASRVLFGASIGAGTLTSGASILSRLLRLAAVILSASLLASSKLRRRLFYPGADADQSFGEPLPDGPLGCPLLGRPFFRADAAYGAGAFYRDAASRLGNPRVWKYYFLGRPFAVVSGGKELTAAMSLEFDALLNAGGEIHKDGLLPNKSVFFETDRARHSFLRRLVGQSLTPARVAEAVPALQDAAESVVDAMQTAQEQDGKVTMGKMCTLYTLSVAWRYILGLDLSEEEIPQFEKDVETWSTGVMSARALVGLGRFTPGYKARENIIRKIEEKLDALEANGPDASTLSGMLFARDEEDPTKSLTRTDVIDNSLILIFAGSETSASTLTNAMLFCGLNRRTWDKLVAEQTRMKEKHGDALTKQSLDDECPYLDAVVKESLRMRPVSAGMPRKVLRTLVIDGKQVPKGWYIDGNIGTTHENDPKTKRSAISNMDPKSAFIPERWLDPRTAPDTDFVPFGSGPRFCLGYNLALLEMKVFLATMARKVDYKLVKQYQNGEEVKWRAMPSAIAQPADGVEVTLTSSL